MDLPLNDVTGRTTLPQVLPAAPPVPAVSPVSQNGQANSGGRQTSDEQRQARSGSSGARPSLLASSTLNTLRQLTQEVAPDTKGKTSPGDTSSGGKDPAPGQLSEEARREVQRLRAIDAKVRSHEAAHKAAGAGVTGAASYTTVTGPDGRQYAVAGEVPITVSVSSADPEQAARQLEKVKQAALAPSDPSSQDRAAAAQAQAALQQAEQAARELAKAEEADAAAQQGTGGTPESNQRQSAPVESLQARRQADFAYDQAQQATPGYPLAQRAEVLDLVA